MLSAIRKFSGSIYAKILLGIIIIPFVFWGMGSTFTSGDKNVVVTIDKEKYTVQDFGNFIQANTNQNQKIGPGEVEELLTIFIGEKLIGKEVDFFKVILSDKSLADLIKHQEEFKKDKNFSRTKYEKFLIENNMSAVSFENNLKKNERKKQLLNFIGGGIQPTDFLVNIEYNVINQKRHIELLNLNKFMKENLVFTQDEIKKYYESNLDKFTTAYRTAEIFELSPDKLTGEDEFNDIYFQKIDEIDDAINQGEKIMNILDMYNLEKANTYTLNKLGQDLSLNKINEISEYLVKNIFNLEISTPTTLVENDNKFFIIELKKTENVKSDINSIEVQKSISKQLNKHNKVKLLSNLISKINKNNFKRTDLVALSKEKNVPIEQITLQNINDDKKLKRDLVAQIYASISKKVIAVHDLALSDNYLIYIDKIENVTINKESNEYEKYLNLSKVRIANRLFNTYDNYIKRKYKIDVNYRALDTVKNYFN